MKSLQQESWCIQIRSLDLVLQVVIVLHRTDLDVVNGKRLLVVQLGVPQEEGERDKRYRQADTGNGKKTLDVLVRVDDGRALGSSNGVLGDGNKRLRVGYGSQRVIAKGCKVLLKDGGQNLSPNSARYCVTEGRSNVISGEVKTGHDCKVLVLQSSLERGLRRIGEHATCDTEKDLGTDDTALSGGGRGTTVMDQQTESDHEEHGASDDEVFEAADLEDDEAQDEAGDDTAEGIQRRDPGSGRNAEVESNNTDSVEVVSLHVPSPVETQGNAKRGQDATVAHQHEGNERVLGLHLPHSKDWDAKDTDNEGGDDVSLAPRC